MITDSNNARRFIEAYNTIDRTIRTQYGIKPSVSFGEAVRQAALKNALVKKYSDELISYARLRNSIVHNSTDVIIAEPHDSVTDNICEIAELLTSPPMVMDVLGRQEVVSLSADDTVAHAVNTIYRKDYSHIPILDGDRLIGVLNSKQIVRAIGKRAVSGGGGSGDIGGAAIRDVLQADWTSYEVASDGINVLDAVTRFNYNRKLKALILTRTGDRFVPVNAIVTASDIITFGNILDKI